MKVAGFKYRVFAGSLRSLNLDSTLPDTNGSTGHAHVKRRTLSKSIRSVVVEGFAHFPDSASWLCVCPNASLSVLFVLTFSESRFSATVFELSAHESAPVSPPSQLSL